MKETLMTAAVAGMIVFTAIAALAQGPLADDKSRESYMLGYQLGANVRQQQIEIDPDLLMSAFRAGLDGEPSALSPTETTAVIEQLKLKVAANQARRQKEIAAKNLADGAAFLAANAKREDVHSLPSGLQYRVIREGDGPMPTADDLVTVNYVGTFIDGTEFDSTFIRNKPATVRLENIVSGWREALPMMKTGSKWQVFMPADLAYGEQQVGPIGPNSTLIFVIELLSIGAENAPSIPMPTTDGK